MGTLTRDELVEEISKNLGGRSDSTRIVRHLNLAQDRIERRRMWPELNVVDQITHTYTGVQATDKFHDLTQGGTLKIRALHALVRIISGENPFHLINVPDGQWSTLVGASDAQTNVNDPTHYNKWKPGYVEFYPVPRRTFSLLRRYRKGPSDFSTSGSNVVSDYDDKDDILIAYATSGIFNSLGMLENGARYFTMAENLMRDAMTSAMSHEDQTLVGRGISVEPAAIGNYITDPFTKRAP